MTGIDTLPPANPGGTPRPTQEKTDKDALAGMDYQAFLKLLVEQMKNQDPTNPMDGTEYMAQLATFAQVEQTVRANARLEEILTSLSMAQGSDLLGRTVSTMDGSVSGVVSAVEILDGGVKLVLQDGTRLSYGPDLVVSA